MKNFITWWICIATLAVFIIAILELIIKFSNLFWEYWLYIYVFFMAFIIWWIAYSSDPENKNK